MFKKLTNKIIKPQYNTNNSGLKTKEKSSKEQHPADKTQIANRRLDVAFQGQMRRIGLEQQFSNKPQENLPAISEEEVRQAAEDLLNENGGTDDFNHESAGQDLAQIAREDSERADAVMKQLLTMIDDDDRDEIAQDFVENLSVTDLNELAATEEGRELLETAREELDKGRTTGDEHQTIRKIDLALNSANFGNDREADTAQAAEDILNIYDGNRDNPADAGEALAAEIRILEEKYGPGAGDNLMQALYERDPILFSNLIKDIGNSETEISDADRELAATALGSYFEGLSETEQQNFLHILTLVSSGNFGEDALNIAQFVRLSGSDEFRIEFARSLTQLSVNSLDGNNLLAAAAVAVAGDPEATTEFLDYLRTTGINGLTGDDAINYFLSQVSTNTLPGGENILSDFVEVLEMRNGEPQISAEDYASIVNGLIDSDLLGAEGVGEAIADFLENADAETLGEYLEAVGAHGVLELEDKFKGNPEISGAVRDALAKASQAGTLSDEFIGNIVENADFEALERLTGNPGNPLSDKMLVLIGQRVRREAITGDTVTAPPYQYYLEEADGNANGILENIADGSPQASNILLQDQSFVDFVFHLSQVDGDENGGIDAILKSGTNINEITDQDSLNKVLMNIGEVAGNQQLQNYEGAPDTVVSEAMAQTLADIYRQNGLAFSTAAGTSGDNPYVFDIGDVRSIFEVVMQHSGNAEIMKTLDSAVQTQITYHLAVATSDSENAASSNQIIGGLLAAYGDERSSQIKDEAARKDAAAQFENDLLFGAITALPGFIGGPLWAGIGSIGANEFAVLAQGQETNVEQAKAGLNDQQRQNEATLKLSVIQAFWNSAVEQGGANAPGILGEFYDSIVTYDAALKADGKPGILDANGQLNISGIDTSTPEGQQQMQALLALTNPNSATAGSEEAGAVFDIIDPVISDIQNRRNSEQEIEREN